MGRNLLAIITNTFTETLRQPIYGVVVAATILLLVLSPSLSMFTMDDDDMLLQDVGLSTLLLAGLLLGVFACATVVTEEIENKTALTVISKTVGRSTFVLGKFFGVVGAVLLAEYLLSLVYLIVCRHGVLQMAGEPRDMVTVTLGSLAGALAFGIALAGNYFYRWRFGSTAILLGTLTFSAAIGVMCLLDPQWQFNPAGNNLQWELWRPMVLMVIGVLILTAVALLVAMRFGMIVTLIVCAGVFVRGVMVEYWLGPVARQGQTWWAYLAWVPLTLVPSLSFCIVTNAVYQGATVPLNYIGQVGLYALAYVSACVLFAIGLFREREIG